jgi:SAM-dependent methyltransferase
MGSARSSPTYDARLYAAVHDGTPGDLAFYQRVCSGARSVLELGCGYGRVLEALVDRVPRLVGLDRDPRLLALATERLAPASVELICADMRAFDLEEHFDRVIIPHSGLFCLLDDEALHACLCCIRRHLAPDGCLALDVYGTDGLHEQASSDDLDDQALFFIKEIELDQHRIDVFEHSTWDPLHQRIDATYVHVPDDGEAPTEGVISQRYLLREQIVAALARAGFRATEIRSGFEIADDDIIVVLARPDECSPQGV